MTTVYLGLGSNIRPGHFLAAGLAELRQLLGHLDLSPVYEGAAMGFSGDPFWNLVARAQTALGVGELHAALRGIEVAHGRRGDAPRNSPCTLDIDILTHGASVGVVDGIALPRAEILRHAFVLRPLADLAPQDRHPQTGERYAALWAAFPQHTQPLSRVDARVLQWPDRVTG